MVHWEQGSVKTDRCNSSYWQGNTISWCPWLDGTVTIWAHTDTVMTFLFVLTVLATQTPLTWCEWQRSSERKASQWTDSMKMTDSSRTFRVSLWWTWLSSGLVSETARPLKVGWRQGPQQTGVWCCSRAHITPPIVPLFVHFSSRVQLNLVLHVEENTLSAVHSCITQSSTCHCWQ